MQDRLGRIPWRRAGFARSPLGPALLLTLVVVGLLVFLGPWAAGPGGGQGAGQPTGLETGGEPAVEIGQAAPRAVAAELDEVRREVVEQAGSASGPAPPWPGKEARIVGRVVDLQGRGVEGARVRFVPDRLTKEQAGGWFSAGGWPEVGSEVDGSFELIGPWVPPVLRSSSQSHWTLRDRACGVRVEAEGCALSTAEVVLDSARSGDAGEVVVRGTGEVLELELELL